MDLEWVVLTFDREYRAEEAFYALRALARKKGIATVNAAVLVQDDGGSVRVKRIQDTDAEIGALLGAAVGGLVGLIGGPLGVLLGLVVGVLLGAALAHVIDVRLSSRYFAHIARDLRPDGAALAVLVEQRWAGRLIEGMSGFRCQVLERTFTPA
jgi:uncharacterized membrane protein